MIRFREYYGMHRGHSVSIYELRFGQKENFTVYFSGKGDLVTSKHGRTIFFPITIFSIWKNLKNWPEKRR